MIYDIWYMIKVLTKLQTTMASLEQQTLNLASKLTMSIQLTCLRTTCCQEWFKDLRSGGVAKQFAPCPWALADFHEGTGVKPVTALSIADYMWLAKISWNDRHSEIFLNKKTKNTYQMIMNVFHFMISGSTPANFVLRESPQPDSCCCLSDLGTWAHPSLRTYPKLRGILFRLGVGILSGHQLHVPCYDLRLLLLHRWVMIGMGLAFIFLAFIFQIAA